MIARRLHKKLIDVAENLYHLPDGRQKHFSFLVERNNIVSVGWNQSFKTHPLAFKFGHRFYSTHSELHAIRNFPYHISELADYKFINLRLMGDHSIGIAKPCFCCQNMLEMFGIYNVYYSTSNGWMQWKYK